jgi:dUTP pyrophosphatase
MKKSNIFKDVCLKINIVNKSRNELPEYQTINSAGLDLRANLETPIILKPLERALISTGLFIELPVGYEAQIRPRSGLAIKNGITVLNSPGTIDSDYRGEIKVILINISDSEFVVNNGERICQMIISKYEKVKLIDVNEIIDTERGSGGFGHTGK